MFENNGSVLCTMCLKINVLLTNNFVSFEYLYPGLYKLQDSRVNFIFEGLTKKQKFTETGVMKNLLNIHTMIANSVFRVALLFIQ